MDTLRNFWAMDCWCTLGIPKPMKMTPKEQYGLGLGILDAMGDLNQGLQQAKGIQLASV